MKIVVIGGTGLIGRKLTARLNAAGHQAVAASPSTGVDILSGSGLAEVLAGADVVVDVTNAPSFEEKAVLAFFETAAGQIAPAEAAAGVRHHVALSVVGADRLPDSGYMRAQVAQERLIASASTPYSIVRATQFFEFMGAIADAGTRDDVAWLSPAAMQPIAADDVADALAEAALAAPLNTVVEIAGPERRALAEFVGTWLADTGDMRAVAVDAEATYFGAAIDDASLVPGAGARILPTRFEDWLAAGLVKA